VLMIIAVCIFAVLRVFAVFMAVLIEDALK
jgi:hypothetical protein